MIEALRYIGLLLAGWIVLAAVARGNRFRKRIGLTPNYETYTAAIFAGQTHPGLFPAAAAALAYPFYRTSCVLFGTKQHVPEPPPPLPQTLDIQPVLARVAFELRQLVPDLPDHLFEIFKTTFARMLTYDYAAPQHAEDVSFEARVIQAKTKDPAAQGAQAFATLAKSFPMLSQTPVCTAYLYSVTSRKDIDKFFFDLSRNDLFPETYRQYGVAANWGRALTGNVSHAFDRMGFESVGDRDSADHVLHNLRDHQDLAYAPIPIAVPQAARFEGTWIVAPQGRGKTTLLSALLRRDLDVVAEGKATVIVMDSKGDLIDHIRQYKEFAPGGTLAGKLQLIEPTANLAINPLDIGATTGHTISLLEYVFAALLDTKTTPLQATLFRAVLIAMKSIPGATFTTFRRLLQDGWQPYEAHIRTLHPEDADFFLKGEFDSKTYKSTRDELLWRIRDLTTRVPLLRDMFQAPDTKVQMAELMDTPNVVVIDNSVAKLAQAGSEFFGRFFIALILSQAQQRAGRQQKDKLPVYVYLDEAQTVIARDENIATIIQTCRSQNIAITFAHQELSQILLPGVQSALGNCAVRFANPDKDAKALADDFRTSPETLQAIPKGNFALFVRDHTPTPLIVSVPDAPASGWPKMTDAELAQIRTQMRDRYSFLPVPPPPTMLPEPEDTNPQKWG
jgi:hypothetical protein